MNKIEEYILNRITVLDKLIAEQDPSSNHYYALMAGKFELLQVLVMTEHNDE